jgi:hypothetical protein
VAVEVMVKKELKKKKESQRARVSGWVNERKRKRKRE